MQSKWLDVGSRPIKHHLKCTALSITRQHKITRALEFPVKSPNTLVKHRERILEVNTELVRVQVNERPSRKTALNSLEPVSWILERHVEGTGQAVTTWRYSAIIFIDHTWWKPYWTRCMQIGKQ